MGNWKSKHKIMLDDPKKALLIYGYTIVFQSRVYLDKVEGVWGIIHINRNGAESFYKSKSNTLQESFEIGDKIIDTIMREG